MLSVFCLKNYKKFKIFSQKGLTNVYICDIIYTEVEGNNRKKK